MQASRRSGMAKFHPAFSLVELLVVLGVITLLAAILLPALQAVHESSRRAQCASQLRQLAMAASGFVTSNDHYPPGVEQWYFNTAVSHRGIPLFAYLLPHLEQQNALVTWDYVDPINNANKGSRSNTAVVLPLLLCPSDQVTTNPIVMMNRDWHYALTSYGGNGGRRSYFPMQSSADGIFHTTGEASEPEHYQQPVRPKDVADGTTHTLLFGERAHEDRNYKSFNDAGWGEPLAEWGWWGASTSRKMIGHVTMSAYAPINYRLPFSYGSRFGQTPSADSFSQFQHYVDLRISAYGSSHGGGVNFAYADGSVRFASDQMSHSTLRAISTRDGQELDQGE